MSYLFYIDDRQNVILRPDCIKLCPELGALDEDELLFVILVYDYHSIYRQFSEQDRIRKAMIHVWNDNNPKILESRKMLSAINAYKSLQYNHKEELVRRYQLKIEQMVDTIEDETSVTVIKNAREIISGLKKDIAELENEISDQIRKEGKIKGGGERSFLEKMMANKEYYERVTAKK